MRDLLTQPLCEPGDLGRPIPDSVHAVSVALPTWRDVVGYEEEESRVLDAMRCGYPRFFVHPTVTALFEEAARREAGPGERALVFPSQAACRRAADFLKRTAEENDISVKIAPWTTGDPAAVLVFPESLRRQALLYWRYAGEVISSRQAEAMLRGEAARDGGAFDRNIRERLARWSGQAAEDVFLFPSGMAAIFAVFRALIARKPGAKTAQIDFPYVDALRVQQSLGPGAHFFHGPSAVDDLAGTLAREPLAAVFCEVPTNPLMQTVDLDQLAALCRKHDVPLVVDDTLGTVANVDVYPYADAVTTSLTKYVSGTGDVLAGAVTLSGASPLAPALRDFLVREGDGGLWWEDAEVLERNSRDFPDRIARINRTAEGLSEFLARHPDVAEIYYPKYQTPEAYERVRRKGGGYSGLISIVLKEAARRSPPFYDALRANKGPSLGTNYSLVCPYTLLAHYQELDWAESCGLSRHLIRIAVGLETLDDLISRFEEAFEAARRV